ncbi:MAG: type II toxin-antitoxin system YafQ family toxin [Firmicutes bacterium]|nr:type II toxin-antitoxin system YafQ family toxin [Bacillota bacterium]
MSRDIVWTSQFKRDYKLAMKRNLNISLLDECIRMLANRTELPPRFYDHDLSGKWTGHRECHVGPDWLLIYRIEADDLILVLTRTSSHSNLF